MPEVVTAPLTKKYFRKEIVNTPLYLKGGGKVPFIALGGDIGILETDDATLIGQLEVAINRRMGGVIAITSEEFEELKKNPPVPRSKPSSLKPWSQIQRQSSPQEEAVVATNLQKPAPLKVPDKEPMLAQLADLKKKSSRLSDVMDTAKALVAEGKL